MVRTKYVAPQQNTSLGIQTAINKIMSDIKLYCSDTLSAEDSKLTNAEALAIVAYLIETRLDIGTTVDGVSLAAILDEIRGK